MTEITDLSPTDSSNTSVTGESLVGSIANMGRMENTLQAILGMFGRWTSSDTIASASTTDIGAQAEAYLTVSGTTTITSFGTVRAGTIRFLQFSGILTLTYNATSLILPGAASITTAAGDTAVFVSEGGGNWRCVAYQRAVTSPARPQAWELISTQTASSSASLNFTNLSAYRTLKFTGLLYPATDAVGLNLRVSVNNGATYESGATYQAQSIRGTGAVASAVPTTGATAIQLSPAGDIGNATNEGIQLEFMIHNFNFNSLYPFIVGTAYQIASDGSQIVGSVGGRWQGSTARNAFQILASSGNLASGYVTLEGIRG